ncbi:Phenylacetate-CoA oxygenase, PaaI subunit [Candidatus Rhodobacter oscarellae]|uniref:Phenylacetate-CoA oxygenase, PaaI subunit n=1 Tax=Candidatus Rhodobacter oscarellae TaxID=1675527 RepID=A0A0J9H3L7_9RHOB|nr:1,2-phenylacetyl-CoA epoxidase subunit PaaC [Candidatus Rhodobacter lobularis]KMW60268.1 Phenylacetate-CoA oxygenase, PaaI subunit [Candidatus Rhodobacter lobularis]
MSETFEYLLRLGDSALILGHRVSEWCGHGPYLEEDIALANTALDLIGQATLWLEYAAEVEGKGRSADDLAYLRDAHEYRNLLLVERPNGDFGQTIMRQFLFDAYMVPLLDRLSAHDDPRIAEIAAKTAKETAYHLERSLDLCVRLGDGTEQSHARMQAALDDLWPYTGEMFLGDAVDAAMGVDPSALREAWLATVRQLETAGTLALPDSEYAHKGGRSGQHSEHLGYVLAEMQWLQRSNPGAAW